MVKDELADRLTSDWYEACEARRLSTDAYHRLRRGLRDFLPLDATAGIADLDDEQPHVVALAGKCLLRFAPPVHDQFLDAAALPIDSIIAFEASGTHESSTTRAGFRLCTWTLRRQEGEPWILRTHRPVGTGFVGDNGGEAVMLALAARLGWPTPLHANDNLGRPRETR